MHAIPSGPFTNVTSLPSSGDHLADMRHSMDAAHRVGRPVDADGAAAVLATGASYLQGATSTLQRLDEGIARRTRGLDAIRVSDPAAVADAERQLEMLQRLRDRVQLSIERVSDILGGRDRDDIPADGLDVSSGSSRDDRRREELDVLQARRALLAPSMASPGAAVSPSVVAGTYTAAATGPR